MFKKFNIVLIISLLILIMIPLTSAANNETLQVNDTSDYVLQSSDEEVALTSSADYYFDASADVDGNGTSDSPYKYLKAERIVSNSNIHLANGEYSLDNSKSVNSVNIYGSDANNTIIKYSGIVFTVSNYLTIHNVTLSGSTIVNNANLNLTNTIMSGGLGSNKDSYGNNYGGAIYTSSSSATVNINNCTFDSNYAVYGGAIYMGAGTLNIVDSTFLNNMAYNYGGAIACLRTSGVTISKTKFYNSTSVDDAGGAIYITYSTLTADNLDIENSYATFGGAITTLKTTVKLSSVYCLNNTAKYNGGAIYHMYGDFKLNDSIFAHNNACDGGALFIDNSDNLNITSNVFINNSASNCAGAIYSLLSNALSPIQDNTFDNNSAEFYDDEYECNQLNLTIGDGNYTMVHVNDTQITILPSSYSLITENQITVAKDQQSGGSCWAFSAVSVIESCLLKATGETYDLSEEHMKNIMALFSDYGWNIETNEGGYFSMPLGYFASWLGPVNESDDVYDDKSLLSALLKSIVHVQNIMFLTRDNYTDNDAIKEALIKYGAVGTTMAYYANYLSGNNAYYCNANNNLNHAVVIVGWDDNYSKSNFRTAPAGDGAWIVQNSWGTNWGNNGYFYVSYYDWYFAKPGSSDIYTIIFNETIKYDKNYQYDIAGKTDYFLNASSSVWYKNVFEAGDDEYLAAVSTYFEKITNWTASIYVNSELKLTQSGVSSPGYYTIDLNQLIPLKIGDVFEVVFNITVDGGAAFPISEICSLNNQVYSPGNSYVSYNGENWADLYNLTWAYSSHTYASQVACIKAFTVLNEIDTALNLNISFDSFRMGNISAIVMNQYGYLVDNGKVTFTVNDMEYVVNVSNGVAMLPFNFNTTYNTVCAIFSATGYNSSYDFETINISKIELDIDIAITSVLNNVTIDLTLSDTINVSSKLVINDNVYNITFIDGKTTLKLTNLENGQYNVTLNLTFPQGSIYENKTVQDSFLIYVKNTEIIACNVTITDEDELNYNITLCDEDGNALYNKSIVFTINGDNYAVVSDINGHASLQVNLSSGNYYLKIAFSGDNNYIKSSNSATITIKTKVVIELTVAKFADNANISVVLSRDIDDNVTLLINGRYYSCEVVDCIAALNLSDMDNGKYNVTVLLDDNKYSFNNISDSFVVNMTKSVFISSDLVVVEGDFYQFNVTLADINGNPIVNRTVLFVLNNNTVSNVSDDRGNVGVKFNLTPGSYDVSVLFDGDDEYFGCEAFNIIKVKSIVIIDLEVSKYQYNVNVTVKLSKNINDAVTLVINNISKVSDVINGTASFNLTNLDNGKYNVTVLLDDSEYVFNNVSSHFVVNVSKSLFISSDLLVFEGNPTIFNVTLVDEAGNPLVNRSVTFTVNNDVFTNVTDSNGNVSVYINLNQGIYDVNMIFEGDKFYLSAGSSNIIKVLRHVDFEISYEIYQNSAKVYINASNNVSCVNITVDGVSKFIKNFTGTVLSLNGLSNGIHNVTACIVDDELYQYSPIHDEFTIDVKNIKINACDLTTYYLSGENFTVTLMDDDGNLIVGCEVRFILNNQIFTAVSDSEGKASIKADLTNGDYQVNVTAIGNSSHYSSGALFNIHVKSTIQPGSILIKTYNSNYEVLFLNQYGNPLKTSPVTFIFNNVKYNMITNENGYAYLNIIQNVGNYQLTVINNLNYESVTKTIQVTSRIAQNKDMTIYAFSGKKYTVRIFDDNGNPVGAGQTVVMKINGITYNVQTDSNGYASLKISLVNKQYTITATYKGFTVSNKITVKPVLITSNKVYKKAKYYKFTAKLVNKNGKALKNKKITFKIKGKKYKAKTNKKGKATIKIKLKLKVGTYKIYSIYGKSKIKNKIKIKK